MKMPGLPQRNDNNQFRNNATNSSYSLSCSNGFWSKHRGDVSYNLLQKFWSDLSPQARQKLLRIDKQSLFEQARKNMYCSKCNGLLNEGFAQIVTYGKSLQLEGAVGPLQCNRVGASKNQNGDLCMTTGCQDDVQDPSVHPWGGLTTTKDEKLTLLDCYLYSKSLKGLQNVFDIARARERERELLYPDACGGESRGWISQGMAGYGRGHGPRESCALHNARLSVDTLVDFWTALGEETRQSLLRMKEDDFIERLMIRFDSKRFCRDCRRNVIREFKELKELKRIRKEPRCTSWFCVADTGFQYEVSHDTVQADWHQTFMDTFGTYHHFEWAVGTGEGKSDILEFGNVGLSGRVQVNGLDLSGLNACYITLRAWKMDGRCTELSVKAHALKGQQCVHCRLVVGDGFVTITRGEGIRRFFEHAEEAEEEEDDDSMDKDGNELDGECSRPQKHAKSPELAREFLLDAATVIFKEQVEKAFRDGTTRQNAHSIFVSLGLKLLEERVHIACKDIITLEKQMKLLEEEEKERREEEERKERRRAKEREKKLRRKERLREKEKDREKKCPQSDENHVVPDVQEESTPTVDEDQDCVANADPIVETVEAISPRPVSPEFQEDHFPNGYISSNMQNYSDDSPDGANTKDGTSSFSTDHSKFSRRKMKFRKEYQADPTSKWPDRRRFGDYIEAPSRSINGSNKQLRNNIAKSNIRIGGARFNEKLHCPNNRVNNERYDFHACSCYQHSEYRAKVEPKAKSVCKSESVSDMSKPYYRVNKYSQGDYSRENSGRPKVKIAPGNNASTRDSPHMKKVWEPMESQKKYPRSNSDSDFTLRSTFKVEGTEPEKILDEVTVNSVEMKHEGNYLKELRKSADEEVEVGPPTTSSLSGTTDPSMGSNTSDSCSSCLSEGDSNTSSLNAQNPESLSTSDSEDAGLNSEERETKTALCIQNGFLENREGGNLEKKQSKDGTESPRSFSTIHLSTSTTLCNPTVGMVSQPQTMLQPLHTQSIHFPIFQPPPVGYYHQTPVSWPPGPTNGLMPVPHPNHYLFASPFGYDLNGNSHFVQYGALQHLAPPLLNPSQVPVYQPVAPSKPSNPKDHPIMPNLHGMKEVQEGNPLRVAQPGHAPTHPDLNHGQNENTENPQTGNTGFSLFHFGGPVALSNGSSKEGVVPSLASTITGDRVEVENACNKDAVEEYNLFAASNGIRFSFF